jgi:hypothetical protein
MNDGGPSSFFTELKNKIKRYKNRIIIHLTSFVTTDDGVEKNRKISLDNFYKRCVHLLKKITI